jgi:hypothetical protein
MMSTNQNRNVLVFLQQYTRVSFFFSKNVYLQIFFKIVLYYNSLKKSTLESTAGGKKKHCTAPPSLTIYLIRFWTIRGGPDSDFSVGITKRSLTAWNVFSPLLKHLSRLERTF